MAVDSTTNVISRFSSLSFCVKQPAHVLFLKIYHSIANASSEIQRHPNTTQSCNPLTSK